MLSISWWNGSFEKIEPLIISMGFTFVVEWIEYESIAQIIFILAEVLDKSLVSSRRKSSINIEYILSIS